MSNGINRWMGLGNLCENSELRFTQSGQAVLNFRIACNESYLNKDGVKQERVEFVTCVLWGKRAEGLSKFLDKGKQVLVEGRLETQKYEKDGQMRYKTQIVVLDIHLLGGGGKGSGADAERHTQGQTTTRATGPARSATSRPASPEPPADDYDGGGYGNGSDNDTPF